MWQKIKDFFRSFEDIEEEHKTEIKKFEMQYQERMQELIELIGDMNKTEIMLKSIMEATESKEQEAGKEK